MRSWLAPLLATSTLVATLLHMAAARAQVVVTTASAVSFEDAISMARNAAPDLNVARANELVAKAGIGVAGIYPNPTVSFGTNTKYAKLSAGVSIPLIILGQVGASTDAARAEYNTVTVESQMVWNEVRTATEHAFVDLWRAEQLSLAREQAGLLAGKVDDTVRARVEVGSAPEIEALRSHAERLRAEADALEAKQLVGSSRSVLGRFIGVPGGLGVHTVGEPTIPLALPTLADLSARVGSSPAVRREQADAAAAEARAHRERVFVRPLLTLDLGIDKYDPGIEGTNYRAAIGVEIPIFSMRGPLIEREEAFASVAKARAISEQTRLTAELTAAYLTFEAASARVKALAEGVVPAAELAADATRDSYALGRAPLVSVLDAERARIDARVSLIEARASRANAWIEVEHIVGNR